MEGNSKKEYRQLTAEEKDVLVRNGCKADDWESVHVSEGFFAEHVSGVSFYGDVYIGATDGEIEVEEGFAVHAGLRGVTLCDVIVGDNCLIEHVSGYICRYEIGDHCYISGVGRMVSGAGTTYGAGAVLSVLNEAGRGNVIIYPGLTSQMAALMVRVSSDATLWQEISTCVSLRVSAVLGGRAYIGDGVRITDVREITDTVICAGAEVAGASRLSECVLWGGGAVDDCADSEQSPAPDANIYIGSDVICENSIVEGGSSIIDGAKVSNCFVGEACHIGRGFSAESSVFLANTYMDNGEACASFCGPFTVSHHKATLLIGCMFSFYNAGSNTNFSNHAYKTGPVHYGVLARGCKTASGAHLLLPADIGPFTMCMGKIASHPRCADMPFSYVIASGEDTWLMPGYNLVTAGTWRDVAKWEKRDMRPAWQRDSIINFDWLSPYIIGKVLAGRRALVALRDEGRWEERDGQRVYSYGNCLVRERSLVKGIRYYDIAARMFFGSALEDADDAEDAMPGIDDGCGAWTDLAGLLVPETETERLIDDLRAGAFTDVSEIEQRFAAMGACYGAYRWNYARGVMMEYYGLDALTDESARHIIDDGMAAREEWKALVRRDAEKEGQLWDMDPEALVAFIASLDDE